MLHSHEPDKQRASFTVAETFRAVKEITCGIGRIALKSPLLAEESRKAGFQLSKLPEIPKYGISMLRLEPQLDRTGRFGNDPGTKLFDIETFKPAEIPSGKPVMMQSHPDRLKGILLEAETEGAVIGMRALNGLRPLPAEVGLPADARSLRSIFEMGQFRSALAGTALLFQRERWAEGFNWLLPHFDEINNTVLVDSAMARSFINLDFNAGISLEESRIYGHFNFCEQFFPGKFGETAHGYMLRQRKFILDSCRAGDVLMLNGIWADEDTRKQILSAEERTCIQQTSRAWWEDGLLPSGPLSREQALDYARAFSCYGGLEPSEPACPEIPKSKGWFVSITNPGLLSVQRALIKGGKEACETALSIVNILFILDSTISRLGKDSELQNLSRKRLEEHFA